MDGAPERDRKTKVKNVADFPYPLPLLPFLGMRGRSKRRQKNVGKEEEEGKDETTVGAAANVNMWLERRKWSTFKFLLGEKELKKLSNSHFP